MKNQANNEALGNWRNLIKYSYEILKHSRRGQKIFINLLDSAKVFLNLGDVFEEEKLLYGNDEKLIIHKPKKESLILNNQGKDIFEIDTEVRQPTPFDKLRRIYDNVMNNPYELEVLYCYLFICGRKDTPERKETFAPLFAIPARLEYDLRKGFELELASDELRLNMYGLAEIYPEKESALFAKGFLECPPLPLTLESVNEVLKKISDFHPSIKCEELITTKYNRPDNLKLPPGKFVVQNIAVLALTKKDNVYLLNDLKRLLDEDFTSASKSVLGRFLQKGVEGVEPDPKSHTPTPFFFPFKNNSSQRKVPEQLKSSQLVHVQGPPGTGKSQTIANLVCHLVATGCTVLVTSQKNKALEVVGEMLDRLLINYLYMMLLKDDKESKKRLKDLIEELLSEASEYNEGELDTELERRGKKLEKCNSEIAKLHQEFCNAQAFEHEKLSEWPKGEIYARYERVRDWDYFEGDESISKEDMPVLKNTLANYFTCLFKVREKYWTLLELTKDPSIPRTVELIDAFLNDLTKLIELLKEELSLSPPEQTDVLSNEIYCLKYVDEKTCEKIQSLKENLGNFYSLDKDIQSDSNLTQLRDKLFVSMTETRRLISDKPIIKEIREDIEKFFSIPLKKRKRKIFNPAAGIVKKINNRLDADLAYLEIPSLSLDAPPQERIKFTGLIDSRLKLLKYFEERDELDSRLKNLLGSAHKSKECLAGEEEAFAILDRILAVAKALLKRKQGGNILQKSFLIDKGQEAFTIVSSYRNRDIKKLSGELERLQIFLPYIPTALRLNKLEECEPLKRYPKTLSRLKALSLQEVIRLKSFHDNLEKLVEAGYLKTLINEIESQRVRSTEEIANDIRKKEEEKLKIIKEYIGTAIKLNLAINLSKSVELRRDLTYFARNLQRSKKRFASFEQLKKEVAFDDLITVLPCWIVSIEDVARIFPLKAGLFDVVIVDESSQCGIPPAIPILYRGKKAVIVGDDKQLHNIEYQFIDEGFNNSKIQECNIEELPRSKAFNCKDNSLFDLCAVFTDNNIFLNEHFRCYPEIIQFCNKKFYKERLKLTRLSLENKLGPVLNLCVVEGAYDDETMKVNKKEAETLVAKLKELLTDEEYQGMSFGVLSIFREQVEFLKDLVFREISPSTRQEFRLIIDTADGFQGDERDVILYSFRYAPNSSPHIFAHLRKEEDYKRLNVALSRARNQIFCFVSAPPKDFPNVLHLKDYIMYVQDPKSIDFDSKPWDSEFEKEVHYDLEQKGLKVYPQFKTCGFRVDFIVTDEKGKVLIVECDGWQYHYDEYGQLLGADVERQGILERAGWKVRRVTS